MKKLLILALVFSMTSAASAALLTLGGATEVDEGMTAVVTGISDTDDDSWFGYIGFDPAVVGVSGVVATANAGGDSYVTPDPAGYTGYYEIAAADSAEPFDVAAGVQFEISVFGAALHDVYTIDLYASDWFTVLDSVQVTVIPEPMTIALLGLGSLFLLRRRK